MRDTARYPAGITPSVNWPIGPICMNVLARMNVLVNVCMSSFVVVRSVCMPCSWYQILLVLPFTTANSSKMLVTKPHSGMIVLMLSRLLPVSWQCHAVVSDHTAPNLSSTTSNHTTIILYINIQASTNKLSNLGIS